jgi:enamine deaminase RidA (YjgF/YER057c/UK114 family)
MTTPKTTPSSSSPTIQSVAAIAVGASDVFVAPLKGGLVSLSANAQPDEGLDALFGRLLREAQRLGVSAVQGNVFGDPRLGNTVATDFPVAYLGRHDTPEGDLRSARVLALPTGSFERVHDADGVVRGARWETPAARHLLLGALTPRDVTADFATQSNALWHLLRDQLAASQFALTDLVRTWFFNHRILDWYDDFNRVRTAFFNEHGIFDTLVPASTGVGASNAAGAALSLDAYAVVPRSGADVKVSEVISPLQCPANAYKSAFSRAVEVAIGGDGRHLLISGTASIEPEGRTAHVGDLDAQIDLSLRVVGAILESRGMKWQDVARAILYFPDIAWMSHFEGCRVALGLPPIPAIFAHCDICRDDLLFEIELDALASGVAAA